MTIDLIPIGILTVRNRFHLVAIKFGQKFRESAAVKTISFPNLFEIRLHTTFLS